MLSAATAAFAEILSPPFRAVLLKSLGLSVAILALAWAALERLIVHAAAGATGWWATALSIGAGVGLLFLLAYMVGPMSSLVSGCFFDELSERVEARVGLAGRPLPVGAALWTGAKFAGLAVVVNILALLVFLLPGVNVAVFYAANGYWLGRVYFEFAALRHVDAAEAAVLRRRHAGYVFLCGLPIALMVSIPIVNLLTPLFAVSYMTRIYAGVVGAQAVSRRANWPVERNR